MILSGKLLGKKLQKTSSKIFRLEVKFLFCSCLNCNSTAKIISYLEYVSIFLLSMVINVANLSQ